MPHGRCYAVGMEDPILPLTNQIALIIAPHAARPQMLELVGQLALAGTVYVLDCGNQLNMFPVSRAMRRRSTQVNAALEHIHTRRAFTCYQALVMLKETPASPAPTLILDLLSTFYDEDVKLPEARRLLRGCQEQLQRLSELGPVLVTSRPPKPMVYAERVELLERLREAATVLWEVNMEYNASEHPPKTQSGLFEEG